MSNYHPSKGLVNRYWKRPKPRIYECNIRDAERFYKDSYNEYLQSKHFSASHGTAPTDIEEQFATKWTLDRMNSRLTSQFDPSRREGSLSGYSGDYGTNDEEFGAHSSRVTFSRNDSVNDSHCDIRPNYRARSLVDQKRDQSPESKLDNIESRLERIRRLREELGLKSDGTMDEAELHNETNKSILKKSTKPDSNNETRGYHNEISQNSYSNSIKTRRSRENEPSNGTYERRYSQRNERSNRSDRNGDVDSNYSSFSNNSKAEKSSRSYLNDETEQYSTRSKQMDNKYSNNDKYSSSYRNKGNMYSGNDNTYESKYSKTAKKSSVSETSNGEGINNADEDDELVSNLKKKFPTSEEILERIKRIDDDL